MYQTRYNYYSALPMIVVISHGVVPILALINHDNYTYIDAY